MLPTTKELEAQADEARALLAADGTFRDWSKWGDAVFERKIEGRARARAAS